MKAVLTLSCEGKQMGGLVFCQGVKNTILDLEKKIYSPNYLALVEYMDKIAKLFEGPCFKNNVVSNALYKIYELEFIDEEYYKYITHFCQMHRGCVVILKLEPK